ncbi:uncharacterized protein LOC143342697 isoform X2 [Colletes latitarsis]|uniref:uncharacterized protein LOC143342697 isoform X2 n=1 Tax=Colletes latitarsis TaxID=2605962 RepID=UPI004035E1FB
MSNVRKTVIALTVENEANNKSNNEAVQSNEINETNETEKPHRKLRLLYSMSVLVLKALDHLFLGVLLLCAILEFVYESEYLKTIVRAIVAVTLELIMWVTFAGVSILMTTMFVADDIYHRNRNTEKLEAPLNEQDGTVSSDTGANTEQQQLKITEN